MAESPTGWSDEVGKLVFTGTRIPLQTFLDFLQQSDEVCYIDDYLAEYPEVPREQLVAFVEGVGDCFAEMKRRDEACESRGRTSDGTSEWWADEVEQPANQTDLKYDPETFVGPLSLEAVRRHEWSRTADDPHMKYDPSYVQHISQFHGGVPGKQWFRTETGEKYRLGRFLNFATKETLPPPFRPSWLDSRRDIRLDWCMDTAQAIANIADGCGAFLVPFGILYAGPHHPDSMDLVHSDLMCFNYKEQGRPRVVVWLNDKAVDEIFRCEQQGLDTWTEMDLSRFTEDVAPNFDEFLAMLREHEDEV